MIIHRLPAELKALETNITKMSIETLLSFYTQLHGVLDWVGMDLITAEIKRRIK